MKAPLVCKQCGKPLDTIWNPDDTYDMYKWDSTQRKYVYDTGAAHMECPHCGSNLQSDYVFDTPEGFILALRDTTDESSAEEVNINGTTTSNVDFKHVDEEAVVEFIKEQHHELFGQYPDLKFKVRLQERGEQSEGKYFQDYYIEPEDWDNVNMKSVIDWWKTQDLPNVGLGQVEVRNRDY